MWFRSIWNSFRCGPTEWQTLRHNELLTLIATVKQSSDEGFESLLHSQVGANACRERAKLHLGRGNLELGASCLDMAGFHQEAKNLLEKHRASMGDSKATLFLQAIVDSNQNLSLQRQHGIVEFVLTKDIERQTSLAGDAFRCQQRAKSFPTILTGLTVPNWDLSYLKGRLGDLKVPLDRKNAQQSLQWACLESAGDLYMHEFIDSLQEQKSHVNQIFDWPIWSNCADRLGHDVFIPEQFSTDFMQICGREPTSITSMYSNFPTLFVAPKGSGSSLHVDENCTHFWMALVSGAKRWRLVAPEHIARLSARSWLSLNPRFPSSLDAMLANAEARPKTANGVLGSQPLVVWEGVLKPGEVIFVPQGWAHEVDNLENSIAISGNFVDSSNLDAVRAYLDVAGLVSLESRALANVMYGEEVERLAEDQRRADELFSSTSDGNTSPSHHPRLAENLFAWKQRWQCTTGT